MQQLTEYKKCKKGCRKWRNKWRNKKKTMRQEVIEDCSNVKFNRNKSSLSYFGVNWPIDVMKLMKAVKVAVKT
uniref:Uncharacterized protein n=1 Tax=Solanum lycopersicum TaxID=4081 RepID=A0A3Q7IGP0_SOLLC